MKWILTYWDAAFPMYTFTHVYRAKAFAIRRAEILGSGYCYTITRR